VTIPDFPATVLSAKEGRETMGHGEVLAALFVRKFHLR
jgi:hypothetical protein